MAGGNPLVAVGLFSAGRQATDLGSWSPIRLPPVGPAAKKFTVVSMSDRPLLTFRGAFLPCDGRECLGPIDWAVDENARIWVDLGDSAARAAIFGALTGQVKPVEGVIEEIGAVVAQSDARLREELSPNRSVADFLQSADAPEYVWLEQRRRPLPYLVDLVGLTPDRTRSPLKYQPPEVLEKFWALRFTLSRARLLVGEAIFSLSDPKIRSALAMRWLDFSGTVVAVAERKDLPGPVDTRVYLSPEGGLALQKFSAPGAPGPAGGRPGEGEKN